ncbi:TolC family protein [uncultured Sphingobacterium sp.]|uniref:TolC family protein n=1 Tax=uncultured Sphingobacterium sp. TaxID=182688 RepID=UPI00374895EB
MKVAGKEAEQSELDYEQEVFRHKIKIATAYLNLLASQRLVTSQERNLERAVSLRHNIATRAKGGLLPGVDSTMASAEVSRANIVLNQAKEQVKIQNNELAKIIGYELQDFQTDTLFVSREPDIIHLLEVSNEGDNHPIRQYFKSRVTISEEQTELFQKNFWPTLSLIGVHQFRGSGFRADYDSNQNSFTGNSFDGMLPTVKIIF